MPTTRNEWAAAYAIQARSDFAVYEKLTTMPGVEECHCLHYLQMACEKMAKAYRLRETNISLESVLTRHVAFSKFIEDHLKSANIERRYRGRAALLNRISRSAKLLARDIERMAPAVDRETTPQNAEYPWEADEKIICPCAYDFPISRRLKEPDGLRFLRFIETAFSDFDEIRL